MSRTSTYRYYRFKPPPGGFKQYSNKTKKKTTKPKVVAEEEFIKNLEDLHCQMPAINDLPEENYNSIVHTLLAALDSLPPESLTNTDHEFFNPFDDDKIGYDLRWANHRKKQCPASSVNKIIQQDSAQCSSPLNTAPSIETPKEVDPFKSSSTATTSSLQKQTPCIHPRQSDSSVVRREKSTVVSTENSARRENSSYLRHLNDNSLLTSLRNQPLSLEEMENSSPVSPLTGDNFLPVCSSRSKNSPAVDPLRKHSEPMNFPKSEGSVSLNTESRDYYRPVSPLKKDNFLPLSSSSNKVYPAAYALRREDFSPTKNSFQSEKSPTVLPLRRVDSSAVNHLRTHSSLPIRKQEDSPCVNAVRSDDSLLLNPLIGNDFAPASPSRGDGSPATGISKFDNSPPGSKLESDSSQHRSSLRIDDSCPASPLRSHDSRPTCSLESDNSQPLSPLRSDYSGPPSPLRSNNSQLKSLLRSDDSCPASPLRNDNSCVASPLRSDNSLPTSPLRSDNSLPMSPLRSDNSKLATPLRSNNSQPAKPLRSDDTCPISPLRSDDNCPTSPLRSDDNCPTTPLRSNDSHPASPLRSDDSIPVSPLRSYDPLRSDDSLPMCPLRSDDSRSASPLKSDNFQPTSSVRSNDCQSANHLRSDNSRPDSSLRFDKSRTTSPLRDDDFQPMSYLRSDNFQRVSPPRSDNFLPTSLPGSTRRSSDSQTVSPLNNYDSQPSISPKNDSVPVSPLGRNEFRPVSPDFTEEEVLQLFASNVSVPLDFDSMVSPESSQDCPQQDQRMEVCQSKPPLPDTSSEFLQIASSLPDVYLTPDYSQLAAYENILPYEFPMLDAAPTGFASADSLPFHSSNGSVPKSGLANDFLLSNYSLSSSGVNGNSSEWDLSQQAAMPCSPPSLSSTKVWNFTDKQAMQEPPDTGYAEDVIDFSAILDMEGVKAESKSKVVEDQLDISSFVNELYEERCKLPWILPNFDHVVEPEDKDVKLIAPGKLTGSTHPKAEEIPNSSYPYDNEVKEEAETYPIPNPSKFSRRRETVQSSVCPVCGEIMRTARFKHCLYYLCSTENCRGERCFFVEEDDSDLKKQSETYVYESDGDANDALMESLLYDACFKIICGVNEVLDEKKELEESLEMFRTCIKVTFTSSRALYTLLKGEPFLEIFTIDTLRDQDVVMPFINLTNVIRPLQSNTFQQYIEYAYAFVKHYHEVKMKEFDDYLAKSNKLYTTTSKFLKSLNEEEFRNFCKTIINAKLRLGSSESSVWGRIVKRVRCKLRELKAGSSCSDDEDEDSDRFKDTRIVYSNTFVDADQQCPLNAAAVFHEDSQFCKQGNHIE